MKRTLCLLLALLALCPEALAETFFVNYGGAEESPGYALLLTDDGTALTPAGQYAHIYPLNPEVADKSRLRYQAEPFDLEAERVPGLSDDMEYYAYHRVALLDAEGRPLTGFDYCSLSWLSDGSIAFKVFEDATTRAGVMDADANVLIEAKYADVQPLGDGRWLAVKPVGEDLCGIVLADADGTETDTGLTTEYGWLPESAGGLCVVNGVREYDGKDVYVDRDGAARFGRGFDVAMGFYGSFAAVSLDGAMFLIDRDGERAIAEPFDYLYHGEAEPADFFIGERGKTLFLIDARTGEIAMERAFPECDYISASLNVPGLLWVYGGNADFLFRTDGVLLKEFSRAGGDVSCMLGSCTADAPRVIEASGEWPDYASRLTDLEGNQIGATYESMTEGLSQPGVSRYVVSNSSYHVNDAGDVAVDWSSFRYGVMDENGAELLPLKYLDYIQVLSPDRYWVSTPEKTGMIDAAGHWYYAINSYEALMD